jgi:RNA polymerase sigma-70 factor (ECF subfamily)
MRAQWQALHLQFSALIHRKSSERLYDLVQARHPELSELLCIDELVFRQQCQGGDPALRNAVLRALVVEAKADDDAAELASTVLILALWPGLDAVHGRLCRDFPVARSEHGGDILTYMSIAIQELDLKAVNRIAATLVMNAERDLRRSLVASSRRGRSELSIETLAGAAALSVPASDDTFLPIDVWRDRLTKLLGRDAALFLRIIILGETQKQAGQALGLSYDAARKRHQRGMIKMKAAANSNNGLSHSPVPVGFYPAETRGADR